ncbi:MAG: hypothetical protein ACP5NY_09310 [Thermocladium sp.]
MTIRVKYLGRLSVVRLPLNMKGESFISHPATAALLGVSPSKAFYEARRGDVGFIFTLASPVRGPQDQQVTVNDVDVYYFKIE